MNCFNRQSIRCQLIIGLFTIITVVFIVAFGVYIGLAIKTRDDLIDGSTEILTNDVIHKMTAILDEKISTLVNLLNQNEEGFLKIVGFAIQYTTLSSGTSMFPVTSYPDNDLSDLKPPVIANSRSAGIPVSLGASSIYFVDQFPNGSNIPDLMITHEEWVNNTSTIDLYCKQLYQNYTDIVAVYYAESTTGNFRKYPGHSTKLTDPFRDYNPLTRLWYNNAITVNGNVSVTDPYLDAFGLGWMITMSFKVMDMSGNIIGVVGIDMLIATIQNNILNFQLDNSKSYLIQENDIVLSAPEWTPSITSGTLFTVNDITETPVPEVWNMIKQSVSGSTEINGYIVIYKNVQFGDQSYFYVTAVPKDTALQVVYEHQSSLENDVNELIVLEVFLLLGALLFMLFIMFIVVVMITKPIMRSTKLADKVGKAVVSGDGLAGLNDEITSAMRNGNGGGESSELQHTMANAFYTMANQDNSTTSMLPPPPNYVESQNNYATKSPPVPSAPNMKMTQI